MNAASKAAIEEATSAFIHSVCAENGIPDGDLLERAASAPPSVKEAHSTVEALEAIRATLYASMEPRIAQAKKQRNDLLPIRRLPVESVVEIFHNVLDSDALCPPTDTPHLERLKTLSSVFSVWRSLVSGTPSLWAVLESTCSPAFLPSVIRKAKKSPLNIRCQWQRRMHSFGPSKEDVVSAFIVAVLPLADQWVTLYLDVPEAIDLPANQIWWTRMPRLRRTSICVSQLGPRMLADLARRRLGDTLSQLKELRLHNVSIDWASVELNGLYVLAINAGLAPPISRLVAILQQSPQLQVLALRFSDSDISDYPSTTPNISLPHLEDLVLEKIPHTVASFLLRSIRTSKLKRCLIIPVPTDEEVMFPPLGPDLEHLKPAMHSALAKGKAIQVMISEYQVRVAATCEPDRECFRLDVTIFRRTELQDHLVWLQRNINLKAEPVIHFDEASVYFGHSVAFKSSIHLPILEWVPNITELYITSSKGVSELVHYLAVPICDGNTVEWRCPRLRRMRFGGSRTPMEEVLEFARRRYGDRHNRDAVRQYGKNTIHWPDTLECLDIGAVQGVDREMVETLEDTTGANIIRREGELFGSSESESGATREEEIFGGSESESGATMEEIFGGSESESE